MRYTYVYLDPTKPGKFQYNTFSLLYEPFYIGKGTGKRAEQHKSLTKCNICSSRPFYCKLKSLKKKNITPFIVILNVVETDEEAFLLETQYIKDIGTRFDDIYVGPLLNMNLGGAGGVSPSKIVRDKISKSRKGKCCGENNINYGKDWMKGEDNPYYGKKHSTEIKQKMKRTYLIWRDGEFTIINDLSMFCKEYGYSLPNATTAANGKHLYRDIKIIKMLDDDIDKYKEILKKVKF